jgi:hypothetical protein
MWQPMPAGECAIFRHDYSLALLADGPTPWGYLRVVPVIRGDQRRVEWRLDDVVVASLRMTDPTFRRGRALGKADYPVVIDPGHSAHVTVGSRKGIAELLGGTRQGVLRRREQARIRVVLEQSTWSFDLRKVWYRSHDGDPPADDPVVRVRDHAVQAPERPSPDRADDWRSAHLLTWIDGVPLAQVAVTHLLRAGTNWAVVGRAATRVSVEAARQQFFEDNNHLLIEDSRDR